MSIYLTAMKNYLEQQNSLNSSKPKALILVAGATGGAQEGFQALERLRESYEIIVVASQAALDLYGEENLKSLTGTAKIYQGKEFKIYDFLKVVNIVFLPVVSSNLVGKLAHGIYDEPLASLIFHAKLAGKPVIGVVDGALPDGDGFKSRGFTNPPPGLVKLINENIEKLRAQEIYLYKGKTILEKLSPYLGPQTAETSVVSSKTGVTLNKRVITREDLLELANQTVTVSQKTIITDLAREYAVQNNIKINFAE
ncbi:microcompartment protein PduM [Carboxydothermus ferrireducens]|uniref:Flavoprotein domain-containing protein n=1 Tax=Carboxydothermus ferrireducens DSM 11255 TaxID=1119529 RepID=A0ABX2R5W1_9THEO|nr:microcompartment protein PduM [Carboxydothermus ferrireducens]NYE56554.1 hypothetical protein [Carboxydothermus ferrireducens DSM 11255]